MSLVVVDSSALIPLAKTGRVWLLSSCFGKKVVLPKVVWQEVVEEGKRLGKNVTPIEEAGFRRASAKKSLKIKGLEKEDLEVLSVAVESGDMLLTNDATLYSAAISQNIRVMWLTVLVVLAVKKKKLNASESRNAQFEILK